MKEKNLINYLKTLKESETKFVICIDANSSKMNEVDIDTSNIELKKLVLFNCSVENILTNKKACDILKDVDYYEATEADNTIYVLGNYINHLLLKKELKKLGIC